MTSDPNPTSRAATPAERARLEELETVIERGLETFVEVGRALSEIRDNRLYRGEYTTFEEYCRERWRMDRRNANRHIEAANTVGVLGSIDPMKDSNGDGRAGPQNVAQTREIAPLVREDEQEAVEVWRELKEEYGSRLTASMVRRVVRPRLERLRREEESARERESAPSPPPLSGDAVRVECCDFRALEFEPGSVDLMLTDPPYDADSLDLWADLAAFSTRVLRPGGVLAAYAGQRLLPAYLDALGKYLDYRWLVAAEHLRGSANVWDRHVQNRWKPLLIFSRGEPSHGWITDLMRVGDASSKAHHPHAQAESEAQRLIETFTEPGELVLDPFAGGGTIPAVAARMGRRVIAAEVDQEAHAVATERVRDAL